VLAVCVLIIQLGTAWSSLSQNSPGVYATYLAIALLAYGLEVDGEDMGFLFLILALPKLHWIDTLLMAGLAIILHLVIKRDRPSPPAILRMLASAALGVIASQAVFHGHLLAGVQEPIRLMIAAGACFLGQHCLNWKNESLWSFPYYAVAASLAGLIPVPWLLIPLCWLTWRYRKVYERRLLARREATRQAASLHLRTIEALSFAIEVRDQPFATDSRRVQTYAVEMAKEMGMERSELDALRVASLLYDIGELAVPEFIMRKPGPLTPEEFEKVKIHPDVAASLLQRVDFPSNVTAIVRSHHERWDGTGYPDGLKGEEIPVGARILAAIDTLDALASRRHHRPALPISDALKQVCAGSGREFDPNVISLLRKHQRRWERMVAGQPSRSSFSSIFAAQKEALALYQLTESLAISLDLKETFTIAKSALDRLVEFDMLVIYVERNGGLEVEYAVSNKLMLPHLLSAPAGEISAWVGRNGKQISNGDASDDFAHLPVHSRPAVRMALSTPLATPEMRGALTLYRIGRRDFSAEDARMVAAVAPPLALAVANGLRFKQASGAAESDPLTGLGNAQALFERLRSQDRPCAVIVCDLDGFKGVNDQFGHLKGNEILQRVAQGFRRSCRSRDFIARLGGDEFVLVLEGIARDEIGSRISHFRDMVIAAGNTICGETVLDASFGAAFFPNDGSTPEQILAAADQAMYRRKAEQKRGVTRFERRAGA